MPRADDPTNAHTTEDTMRHMSRKQIEKMEELLPELSLPSLMAIQIRLSREIFRRFGVGEEFSEEKIQELREAATEWPDTLVEIAAERFGRAADECEVGQAKVLLERTADVLYAELASRGEEWKP